VSTRGPRDSRSIVATVLCATFLHAGVHRACSDENPGRGRVLFLREWLPNDPRRSEVAGDGLGPVYNETSCAACHFQGGVGGSGPRSANVQLLAAESERAQRFYPGLPSAGSVMLHRFGTDPAYTRWRLKLLGERFLADKFADIEEAVILYRTQREMQKFVGSLRGTEGTIKISERNPPTLFGVGLIDTIPDEVLLAAERSRFEAYPGVRGHVRRNKEGRVGKLGWKGEVASLERAVFFACANDVGLEVPGHRQAKTPNSPDPKQNGIDLSGNDCAALIAFVRGLPPPIRANVDGLAEQAEMSGGRSLFEEIGCAACHTPTLGNVRGLYSDLLLHDMGSDLADAGQYYASTDPNADPKSVRAAEWRTPPLWGLAASAPFLHDGRARNVEEAVAFHGGEAASSAFRYFRLDANDRLRVQMFLRSL
jgi:CxxC motif-containing protein (DUF1111 family)